jgi:hypothetical protein
LLLYCTDREAPLKTFRTSGGQGIVRRYTSSYIKRLCAASEPILLGPHTRHSFCQQFFDYPFLPPIVRRDKPAPLLNHLPDYHPVKHQ